MTFITSVTRGKNTLENMQYRRYTNMWYSNRSRRIIRNTDVLGRLTCTSVRYW